MSSRLFFFFPPHKCFNFFLSFLPVGSKQVNLSECGWTFGLIRPLIDGVIGWSVIDLEFPDVVLVISTSNKEKQRLFSRWESKIFSIFVSRSIVFLITKRFSRTELKSDSALRDFNRITGSDVRRNNSALNGWRPAGSQPVTVIWNIFLLLIDYCRLLSRGEGGRGFQDSCAFLYVFEIVWEEERDCRQQWE